MFYFFASSKTAQAFSSRMHNVQVNYFRILILCIVFPLNRHKNICMVGTFSLYIVIIRLDVKYVWSKMFLIPSISNALKKFFMHKRIYRRLQRIRKSINGGVYQ